MKVGAKRNIPETFSFHPFEGLKKMIEGRGIEVAAKPAVRKSAILEKEEPLDDEELFIREMSGVKEIREFRSLRADVKRAALPCRTYNPENEALVALREIIAGRRAFNLA